MKSNKTNTTFNGRKRAEDKVYKFPIGILQNNKGQVVGNERT